MFPSPLKSPPIRKTKEGIENGIYSNASTKAGTASAGGGNAGSHHTFGLSNCLFKCEVNEQEGSPEVEIYRGDADRPEENLKIPTKASKNSREHILSEQSLNRLQNQIG